MAKNLAHSLKVRLLKLSNHDNRRYQQLLVRFMHERFLYRLSLSKYKSNFILKGGALLYAYEEFLPRPTLDVDFLGTQIKNERESIISAFKEIATQEVKDDGARFISESVRGEEITVENKYPGIRITLDGTLDTIVTKLSFDIGFGDIIIPRPNVMDYPIIIETMDIPNVTVYSLETVVAEKIQTIVDRSIFNSRMKDFFDLYRIVIAHSFERSTLLEAIKATFNNRETDLANGIFIFSQEFATDQMLQNRWVSFCKKTKIDNPLSFPETMRIITNFFTPLWNELLP